METASDRSLGRDFPQISKFSARRVIASVTDLLSQSIRRGGDRLENKYSGSPTGLRSEPSIDAPILFDAKKGDTFHVISLKEGWLEVSGSDGKKGWISQKLTWGYAPK